MPDRQDRADRARWKTDSRLLLLAVALVLAVVLLWQLTHLLLLIFGSVLIAVLLRGFADLIGRYSPLGPNWSLAAASLLILLFSPASSRCSARRSSSRWRSFSSGCRNSSRRSSSGWA